MIFDKKETPLKYGDICRNETEKQSHGMYRFCYEKHRGTTISATFVDKNGRLAEFPASQDGIIDRLLRIVDFDEYEQVAPGAWVMDEVEGDATLVCSCCGSEIPTATVLGSLDANDCRYCYFCGAKMEELPCY